MLSLFIGGDILACPVCNGKLKKTNAPFSVYDIPLGEFDAEVCQNCHETYFTEESSDEIDRLAKSQGLWGLERKTKIAYSGNSLVVRIPKEIVELLQLERGVEVRLRPEGKKRLVVELAGD